MRPLNHGASGRKFFVLGGGSMGKRRIRCLQAHGVQPARIRVFDCRADRRLECQSRYGVEGFESFEEGMEWDPQVVVISLPSRLHMTYCLKAAQAGRDFWCEIALSDSLENTEALSSLVDEKRLVAALGINTPFHPLVRQTKAWIQDPEFGPPIAYRLQFGNYLPNWHPWEPYQYFYDETQIMGVIAQELGILYAVLETRLSEVYAQLHRLGKLEIEGPDYVEIVGRTESGVAVSAQIDLMQDDQQHDYRVISNAGVVELSLLPETQVRRYLNSNGHYEMRRAPRGYQFEQCYVDEFTAFLQALEDRTAWYHPLSDGIHILRCLEAIQESNRTGRKVTGFGAL
ncbi:MAG: scyllo-inositol 2-dehydrogenase (NAD(+)) [Nitrospira sp.]|nr:scyllo-inositol 2-dehydrogenase (NAD(+)) [Nitrospira sp.]